MSVPAPFLDQVSIEQLLDGFKLPKESLVNSTDAVMTPVSDGAEPPTNGESPADLSDSALDTP